MNEWAHEQKNKLKSMDIFFKNWELGGQKSRPQRKEKRIKENKFFRNVKESPSGKENWCNMEIWLY